MIVGVCEARYIQCALKFCNIRLLCEYLHVLIWSIAWDIFVNTAHCVDAH